MVEGEVWLVHWIGREGGRWGVVRWGGVVEGKYGLYMGLGGRGVSLEFRIGHSYSAVYGTQLKSTKLTE